MRVSSTDDNITHAIIGQKESIAMGLSDDASLMHILSTNLYTYPELATVREIICNAWDSHIVSEITDIPLEIKISDTEISIRDFGSGIPHDKIGQIYGVYGNSTKRDDSRSTGGFKIGSKAPFAYTDNFQVVSCHHGTKTIYHISRSSIETNGKPSINTITSMPTNESGITVSFNLKNKYDFYKFESLIKNVLILGEILAKINDQEPIETLPLSKSNTGYIVIKNNYLDNQNKLNIRYGNVVYPIPRIEHYKGKYNILEKILGKADLIFKTEANTVSIAPNRESLILTEGTVLLIEKLMDKAIKNYKPLNDADKKQIENEIIINSLKNEVPSEKINFSSNLFINNDSLNYFYSIKKYKINDYKNNLYINNKGSNAAKKRLLIHKEFYLNNLDKSLYKSIVRNIGSDNLNTLFIKKIIYPIKLKLKEYDKNELGKFYIRNDTYKLEIVNYNYFSSLYKVSKITKFFKKILLVNSKIRGQVYANKITDDRIIWVVPNNKESKELAIKICKELGWDYLEKYTINKPRTKTIIDKTIKIKKPKEVKWYPSLNDSYRYGNFTMSNAINYGQPNVLTKPIAWTTLVKSDWSSKQIPYLNGDTIYTIKELFGNEIAVVKRNQSSHLLKEGVPELKDFLINHIESKLINCKTFVNYITYIHSLGIHINDVYVKLFINMYSNKTIIKKLKLKFELDIEKMLYIDLYFNLKNGINFPNLRKLEYSIKQDSDLNRDLITKIQESKYYNYIDINHLQKNLNDDVAKELLYKLLK